MKENSTSRITLEYDDALFKEYHGLIAKNCRRGSMDHFVNDITSVIKHSVSVCRTDGTTISISEFRGSGKAQNWSHDRIACFVALAMHTESNRAKCLKFLDEESWEIISMAVRDIFISDNQIVDAGLGSHLVEVKRYYYRTEKLIDKIWYMFDNIDMNHSYSRFYPNGKGPNEHIYRIVDGFRLLLRKVLIPAEKDFAGAEVPEGTEIFNVEADASVAFPVLRMAITNGDIKYKSSVKVTEASARKILSPTSIRNIATDYPNLKFRHHIGQLTIPFIYSEMRRNHMKSNSKEKNPMYCDVVREILLDFKDYRADFLISLLLPHLRISMTDAEKYFLPYVVEDMVDYIISHAGQWITPEAATSHALATCRSLTRDVYQLDYSPLVSDITCVALSWTAYRKTVEEGLARSMFALLYGLGAAEVACSTPDSKNYTTPYEHLRAMRLTALGRYAFGLVKTYELRKADDVQYFEFDSERLVVRSLVENNPYVGILRNIAVPSGKSRFIVSPDSFLRNCHSIQDIESNVKFLKTYLCSDMPKVWTDFFDVISQRCRPFTQETEKYSIIRLNNPSDQNLIHIIGTDPEIRAMVLKVEGMKLLVPSKKMNAFTERMKHFGYLV